MTARQPTFDEGSEAAKRMYLEENAEWYLAWIVQEIRVEGDPRNVVHTCTRLIRAHTPEEAYEKAVRLGKEEETTYQNPYGKTVKIVFRGLTDLGAIYEDLEDGAELAFQEEIGIGEAEISKMLTEREHLTAFQKGGNSEGPCYVARDMDEEMSGRFKADGDRAGGGS